MAGTLDISGIFGSDQELLDTVQQRQICYDVEPFYRPDRKGTLLQIGFQISLYGTLRGGDEERGPDAEEYAAVERDVRRVAQALAQTCNPLHMAGTTITDVGTVTYSHERGMRPDVTVHIPVFDQEDFGHAVDDHVRKTLEAAVGLLQSVGVSKSRWQE